MACITPDGAHVITVIAGADALCCSDLSRLQKIRTTALERLACIVADASALVTVADQSWDYAKAISAMRDVVQWCDQQIDSLDGECAYIVSSGPMCPY